VEVAVRRHPGTSRGEAVASRRRHRGSVRGGSLPRSGSTGGLRRRGWLRSRRARRRGGGDYRATALWQTRAASLDAGVGEDCVERAGVLGSVGAPMGRRRAGRRGGERRRTQDFVREETSLLARVCSVVLFLAPVTDSIAAGSGWASVNFWSPSHHSRPN
jgi:hypothetical protein